MSKQLVKARAQQPLKFKNPKTGISGKRIKREQLKIDSDYSKYIEKAILMAIALGVLSVFWPQLGILAGILALIVIAAIVDTKLKHMHPEIKSAREEREMRHIRNLTPRQKKLLMEFYREEQMQKQLEMEREYVNVKAISQR